MFGQGWQIREGEGERERGRGWPEVDLWLLPCRHVNLDLELVYRAGTLLRVASYGCAVRCGRGDQPVGA